MKKSKVILAIALAVVFIITCMNVPTFSWFTRPKSKSGEEMVLQTKNEYTAYNGTGVTISTAKSSDGGVTYDGTPTDYSGTGISPYTRNYFCTTITNNSGTEQNVSLYASKLSIPSKNNGTLALGVNGPTRSYRDYTSQAKSGIKTTSDVMRVYFENYYDVDGWKDQNKDYYICWTDDPNTNQEILVDNTDKGHYYKLEKIDNNHYYADIPKTATHAFFAVQDWGTNDNGNPNWGQRSQTLWNIGKDGNGQTQTQSVVFKITSGTYYTNGHNYHVVESYKVNGACINTYYSTISIAAGDSFNAALSSGEYIGSGLKYTSGNSKVFTVDTNGKITAVGVGEAILTTTVTGSSYKDTAKVETVVKVTAEEDYEFNDVPIVRNILIPAADDADDADEDKNVVKVYWYVINNSNSNSLTYTIDSLYLGL